MTTSDSASVFFDSAHVAPALGTGDPVREAAGRLIDALRANGEDPTKCPDEVIAALAPLAPMREDLFGRAQHRPSKNPGHQISTIYFDPSLMIQVVGTPRGFRLPAHTHSAWNVLYITEGEMQFRWYRRRDDHGVAGKSQLEVADDRVLRAGQAGIVGSPPNDIHELEVLSEYLWMIVVTPEPEVAMRQIHSPDEGSYEERPLAVIPPLLSRT